MGLQLVCGRPTLALSSALVNNLHYVFFKNLFHTDGTATYRSMTERNTDVTTFSKTFQDPQDLFQIVLLYIDFQTHARDYKEDLLVIALLEFVILIAH